MTLHDNYPSMNISMDNAPGPDGYGSTTRSPTSFSSLIISRPITVTITIIIRTHPNVFVIFRFQIRTTPAALI